MTTTRRSRNDPARTSKLPVATCGGCIKRWQSLALAHCSACHHSFGSVDLFDRHRIQHGEHGGCKDPRFLSRMVQVEGVWREPAREEW